jgi:ABC-type multidrug transport system fused ATPase/permease subunit
VGGCDVVSDSLGARRHLGYVSATTGVPDRLTAREIMRSYGRLHGLDEGPLMRRIDELVRALGLAEFADRPAGRLSSGQRQRVSLARALVHDPPSLVLDEPTAALDAEAEHAVFERFRTLAKGRTTILISHRFSTVRMADQIIVLDHGAVIERGSHDELVAQGGRYATLFHLQAQGYR